MSRDTALGSWCDLVAQPNVRERASHHDFVVAPAGAIRIELCRRHLMAHQVCPRGSVMFDGPGGRDVISGDAVGEQGQHPRTLDVGEFSRLLGHILEKRRVLNVCRPDVPLIRLSGHGLDFLPSLGAREHVPIALTEHFRSHA